MDEMIQFNYTTQLTYYTRSSATAEKQRVSCPHRGRGTRPSNPLPLRPLCLYLCVWSNPKATTYVRQACRKTHFNMNRAFKVIQGHPYWCRHESRTVCCRNVQLMPTLFLKLTKIRQRKTANSSISTTSRRFEDVPGRNPFEYLQMAYIARN